MKIYLVTHLGETFDMNTADSFAFKTKEEARTFIEEDSAYYLKEHECELITDVDSEIALQSGCEYFNWTIKEVEL